MPDSSVRIDQSHCNFTLSNRLSSLGWQVLFRDPGRATRGRSGLQASVHQVFVQKGLPIPDIVAASTGDLLLIEVERSYSLCRGSLISYEKNSALILERLNSGCSPALDTLRIRLGFCKIGAESKMSQIFSDNLVELVVSFPNPHPTLYWRS